MNKDVALCSCQGSSFPGKGIIFALSPGSAGRDIFRFFLDLLWYHSERVILPVLVFLPLDP